jgi:hypothetical protein
MKENDWKRIKKSEKRFRKLISYQVTPISHEKKRYTQNNLK